MIRAGTAGGIESISNKILKFIRCKCTEIYAGRCMINCDRIGLILTVLLKFKLLILFLGTI